MTQHDKRLVRSHDDILEEVAAALDIPPSLFEEAEERYKSLAEWLDRDASALARYNPAISPQGSFLLGTVTRPLARADEYDVDLVCLLNGSRAEFTQKGLKEAVGREIALYVKDRNMKEPAEEGRRCWTLHYADRTRFHMDVLPALPDAQRYRQLLENRGFGKLARDASLTDQSIAITDRTTPNYEATTGDWPQSNPFGFAVWFRNRMAVQLQERKRALAEAQNIKASVDEIPDYRVKTPLQRAIQLLKRHRDSMFAKNGEHKPISIIITTLAARTYNNEPTIAGALQSILTHMHEFIENRQGVAWVVNPVNPAENFADKWEEEPLKQKNFYSWLEKAQHDFALYLRASPFDSLPEELKKGLGHELVAGVLNAVVPVAAPAIISVTGNPTDRVEMAVKQRQSAGSQSKPWAR